MPAGALGFNLTSLTEPHLFLSPTERTPSGWAWWCVSVIPALRRLREEDFEFEASLCNSILTQRNKIQEHHIAVLAPVSPVTSVV